MGTSFELDHAYDGPYRFFVPEDMGDGELPKALTTARSVGQMCNDLAMTVDSSLSRVCIAPIATNGDVFPPVKLSQEEQYERAADDANLLQITYVLELEGDTLVPTAPLLTLTRSTTFTNVAPMEVGCRYGFKYWEEELSHGEKESD